MAHEPTEPTPFLKFPRTQGEVAEVDLSCMKDTWCADMVRDGMNAIVLAQGNSAINANGIDVWNYLSTYEPPSGEGFMFSRGDMVITCIQSNMQVGHSGSSMAFTMRHLQLLAKIGISKYCQSC
jgi:hypothetical protein